MNTKLTLSIDDDIIQQAKLYAKSRKQSVSKLVEEYLYSISQKSDAKMKNEEAYAPIVSELLGMIKTDSNIDYKKVLEESLMEKYL